ncbi:MAG: 3-isopropylmalate dehydratase large subunit [Candidatus Desulfovibrio kirbyi]|uniref:3-isopropylmalate dehydratase large subunit n=1 Tax=Candidatus Desulfovibrio kirbyi TaxID=2696086 RepID=A0A6L2R497_9BACT|nr:MAG: 3-isopropylmalate dehydratase large subunit [Candidatus Desulfovibrio kirbyi]
MPQTLAQKILQAHSDDAVTDDGQIIRCRVSLVLANDITAPLAIQSFCGMGATKVFDNSKIALLMDHFTPQKDIASANQVLVCRLFAKEQNIAHYYEGGNCGVEHAFLPEQGLVGPGDLVVGADSHTCTYGGIGAFATGMGSTDIAGAMALGETWFKTPPTVRIIVTGALPKWLRAKDIMLLVIGRIGVDGALYRALEFGGPVIDALPVEGRLTIANMAIEAGGKAGLFAVDAFTRAYCAEHGRPGLTLSLAADANAAYEQTVTLDVTGQEPVVACPHIPSNVKPVSEVKNTVIQQVIIGSCTNGRISDMRDAAEVLRGRKVDRNVRCIVLPATPSVWKQCLGEGLMEVFMEAGCIVGPATCGPCLGGHMGILGDGERAVATTNRNFRGRMGSLTSEVYLASPVVAAASAVAGVVASPAEL